MDNGRKPLMQIGALLLTAATVIATIAAGVALTVGALPPEAETFAQHLALVGPIGAALALGLTAIGKGLYEIGKNGPGAPAPEQPTVDETTAIAPLPVPPFAEDRDKAAEAVDAEGER